MKAVCFIVVALLVTAECKSVQDEKRWQTCSDLEFLCANGRCIPQEWVCDTDNDCGDNSDEQCDTCTGEHQFRCKHGGGCIPVEKLCDNFRDCSDGSDETHDLCLGIFNCSPGEIKCPNNRCIESSWLCDGDNDCGDRWDENPANCPAVP